MIDYTVKWVLYAKHLAGFGTDAVKFWLYKGCSSKIRGWEKGWGKRLGKAVEMASLPDNGFGTTDGHIMAAERLERQNKRL